MKLGIVSDVHSNLPALKAVKDSLDHEGVDAVFCAGDIVGYGANPNECCRVVSEWTRAACVGNHDLASLRSDPAGMNPHAALAAVWTAKQLDDASRTYLGGLLQSATLKVAGVKWDIHHGSLRSVWEYLYEEDVTERLLQESGAQVLVFGHTHVPFVRRFRSGIIVNPGSVGQPRDGDPRASFAVFDPGRMDIEIVRVDYDIGAAAEAILDSGIPPVLAERLYRGR